MDEFDDLFDSAEDAGRWLFRALICIAAGGAAIAILAWISL